ncbi:hypothetical protein [Zhenhengia yiwuensis]|uniref:Uncharacterized protein n=1 Tax=Zhenhengia yiwuensis TaxID=2763666 RepID=A0A926EDB2_9FIRM|nr:hypothetical protein [Zhenhengia yiwuensis]MBC8578179.1 hypothetical protein [Zhenhengia yiwuensis]
MKVKSAVLLDKRLEQILTEMEMNNQQVKRLRKAKKKLFSKANPSTKQTLLEYEELESIERTIAVRTVYIQAINDT